MKFLNHNLFTGDITVNGTTTLSTATGVTRPTGDNTTHLATTAFVKAQDYATNTALGNYVPISRTLTINGVTYDLSANRSWTIATADYTSTVKHVVKAGVAITKGQAIYVTSADGTNMIVGLASNATEATSSKTMGLAETTVSANGFTNVITEGLLAGLDTSTAGTEGDPVWLGTNGNLIYGLANKPYAPAHLVFIGIVTRKNANNGEIFVKVQNGFELNEIHDVDLKTIVPVNGHILGFDGTLWVNKTIAGWLGYTPANASGTTNYVSKFTGTTTLGNSQIFDNGTNVGIGTTSPLFNLQVGANSGTIATTTIRLQNSYLDSNGYYGFNIDAVDNGVNGHDLRFLGRTSPTGAFSEVVRIKNSGNVGIGVTNPVQKLEVAGVISAYDRNNGSANGQLWASTAAGVTTVILHSSGNSYLNGGNVGIGTTSPSNKLQVANGDMSITTGYSFILADTDTNWRLGRNIISPVESVYLNSNTFEFVAANASDQGWQFINDDGYPVLEIGAATGSRNVWVNAGNLLVPTGSVGIGTTSPAAKLHVYQSNSEGIYLDGVQEYTTFKMLYGGNQKAEVVYQYSTDQMYFNKFGTGTFAFYGGSVGIGTGSPSEKLHVDGRVRITTIDNGTGDFATISGTGVITRRTAAQVLSDIGAQPSGSYLTAEADTLATVTSRGSSTNGSIFINGIFTGGLGAVTTSGTLDWNDISNARAGQGHTLLLGTATNGMGGGQYYHPVSFEYSSKNGSGNMTQLAIPYTGNGIWYRNRYGGSWSSWARVWDDSSFTSTNITNWNTAYGWGNHASQGYATQTYVNTAIANLVDSAPSTLDTLNELAAALGDDPNFATTVTNSIATKVPQTRTLTINGTSYDLSADRSWTIVAGVSSVNAGTGVSVNSTTGAVTVSIGQSVATSAQVTFDSVITNNNGNGTNVRIGDDAWLGDINLANTIRIQGAQNSNDAYIVFGSGDATALGRAGTGALTYGGNTVWHAGNDGSGSGLDADLLDGQHASAFAAASHNHDDRYYTETESDAKYLIGTTNPGTPGNFTLSIGNNGTYSYVQSHSSQPLRLNPLGNALEGPSGSTIWHSGNDGAGSGLDADTLDGLHASSFLTAESDTLATVTARGASTSTNITANNVIIGSDVTYGDPYRTVAFGNTGDGNNRILASRTSSDGMYFMAATGQGFNFRPNGGTANLVVISSSGSVVSSTDMRAPIFYDSNDTNYYLDLSAATSSYAAGVFRQNNGKYVRDSHYRTYSGYSDYYSAGNAGWYRVAEITLTANCSGAVLYGTLYDHRYDGADAYQVSIVARAECSFTSDNEQHYINVGCTILGSTNYVDYKSKIRVVLSASSAGSRTYEVQFYETNWNHDTWQLESTGWTVYTTPQAPRTAVGTPKVYYVSNQNADYQRANTATYSPVYYDSDDTTYYADFNSTSGSAIKLRGGILTGPNPSWSQYLQLGGDGNNPSHATVAVTNGNLHIDAKNGYATYINHYYGNKIYLGSGGAAGGTYTHSNFSLAGNLNLGGGDGDASHRLQVIGNALVQGTQGFNAAGETASLYIGDTASEIRAVYDGGLDFYQNSVHRVRIEGGTGNFGIGTSSPGTKLDVNGVITATGGNSTLWNTAYGWGNHASAGYLTSYTETDTLATVTGRGASTSTFTSLLGGSKIVIQNGNDGGNGRGIFMWTSGDSNWGIYMSTASAGVSLAGGTAVASIDGRTSHHIRFRAYNATGNGFIWENDSEQCLMSLTTNTGNLYTRGQIYAGNNTSNLVWHAGNDGSGSGLDADLWDGYHVGQFSNWNSRSANDIVTGMMSWRNYGNNHVIFDASSSLSPAGTAISNSTPEVLWSGTYPTLMGWNGTNTYGVRVDVSRTSEYATNAGNVAWTGVTAGERTNYTLGFEAPSTGYAGFYFSSPGGNEDAGYFLVRGGADNDVYTQNGITLVADAGWLTLAQRTTAGKGVRIMSGTSSTTRMSFNADGTTYLYTDLYLGSTNTRITATDASGYVRLYGSAGNYLALGPYNNNGWAYFENSGNANGIYFNSPGRYAFDSVDVTPYTDAENSLGAPSYRWSQVYTSGWLRQYGAQGMYNQDYGTHFYSNGGGSWAVTGSGGNIELQFRSNHQSTLRGYVYADTGNNIGFLNNGGSWSFRTTYDRNAYLYGSDLTIGEGGAGATNIIMKDGDEGDRVIHCNSNRIGFLTQSGSWGAYLDDSTNWFAVGSVQAPIFYDSDNTAYYLDPNSNSVLSTAQIAAGLTDNGNTRIYMPGGAWSVNSGGGTGGAIKISLPTAMYGVNTMMSMTVQVYEYSTGQSFTIRLGGYNYYNHDWYNVFAYLLNDSGKGSDVPVYFGNDGTRDVIWIGEPSWSWSYPNVFVTDFQAGHTQYAGWRTGWSVSFDTGSRTNVSASRTAYRQIDTGNYNSYSPTLTGGGASGTWGISISGNAATATSATSATTATTSSNVTVNSGNTSAAWYPIVWHSGNTLYSSSGAEIYAAGNYIRCQYINTSDNDETGITRFVIKNGDNYHRSATTTTAANVIRDVASGSWGISITGNAATASSASSATNLYGPGGSYIKSSSTGTSYTANYQIRENDGGGNNTNEIYAPQLAFHWSGVVASSIMLEASGRIAIRNNPGGAYEAFMAGIIYSSGYGDSTQWNTAYSWGNHASAGYVTSAGSVASATSATQVVTIQDTPPAGVNGKLWWESDTGKLKVYYGSSSAWVDATPVPDMSLYYAKAGGPISGDVTVQQTLTVVGNTLIQGTLTETSDISLKENILPLESSLDKVMKLNGVSFNKKATPNVKEIGFIAQEVETVIPDLVTETNEGIKTVSYSRVTAVLVETIKEQQAQIEELKNMVNMLAEKLNSL